MSVFTIYNCGTSYDEYKDDLISNLFADTQGARAKDKLICAGPGSTLMTRAGYDPAKEPEDYETFSPTLSENAKQGARQFIGGVSGVDDVQFNVDRVLKILKGLPYPKPGIVNMAGWSRGACTCHAMANAMSRDKDGYLNSVPVNIFAFDPVPGTGNLHIHDWTAVPGNVANYMAIFMENEYRQIMRAAAVTFDSSTTRKRLLNLPGQHCFAVEATEEFEEVAKVGSHLAEEFLREQGTAFRVSNLLTDLELLENYASMIEKTGKFFVDTTKLYDPTSYNETDWTRWSGSGDKVAYATVDNHLLSKSPYFINSHHKRIFQKAVPVIYKYYFELGIFPESRATAVYNEKSMEKLVYDRRLREQLESQLLVLSGMAPKTYETLHNFAETISKTRNLKVSVQGNQQKKKQVQFGQAMHGSQEDMSDAFASLFKAA